MQERNGEVPGDISGDRASVSQRLGAFALAQHAARAAISSLTLGTSSLRRYCAKTESNSLEAGG
jgi:hypothetical protein